jgi:hypothetical protein
VSRAAWLVAVWCVAAASCGGGDGLRAFENGEVACEHRNVRVLFDPRQDVVVEADGSRLAYASFAERRVDRDCDVVREGPAPNATEKSPYRDGGTGEGIYRRVVELTCAASEPFGIAVHPIFNASIDANDGSVLLVLVGDSIVASAVLKSKGDPRASRIYHAPRFCTSA